MEASVPGTLPDGEFALYWGDDHESISGLGNLRKAYGGGEAAEPLPPGIHPDSILPVMLQFSKSEGQPYVLMPFSAHQRCGSDNIDSLLAKHERFPGVPWADRTARAFGAWTVFCAYWQAERKWPDGVAMGCAREDLLELSKQHSELLDLASVDDDRYERAAGRE